MLRALDASFTPRGLRDASLATAPGTVTGIVGPNGSGKSTTLALLTGALTPTSGAIYLDDRTMADLSPRERARSIAVVAQADATPYGTVAETVLLGRTPHLGAFAGPGDNDIATVSHALARMGLSELATRDLTSLSGGERQRAVIARALAQDTQHLVLDEPTNHLDVSYQHELMRLVTELAREGRDVLIVLHDLTLAATYCDEVAVMSSGAVVAKGDPRKILSDALLRDVFGLSGEWVATSKGVRLIINPVCGKGVRHA